MGEEVYLCGECDVELVPYMGEMEVVGEKNDETISTTLAMAHLRCPSCEEWVEFHGELEKIANKQTQDALGLEWDACWIRHSKNWHKVAE